jgi:two-component system chemotaxis sensor kinase CheA
LERRVSAPWEALRQGLDGVSLKAALLDGASAQAVGAQADAVISWLREAVPALPGLAPQLSLAERVAEGLRRGFDPAQGLERLNLALSAADAALRAMEDPQASAAPLSAPATEDGAAPEASFLAVPPEDREGWEDFLVEGPELLGSVEAQLVGALRHEAFDVQAVLRPLHTLKGICGMLGLSGQNRLMHACEDLLAPYRQAQALPDSVAEAALAAMDRLRAQIDAIAAGLEQGGFAVLETAPLEAALSATAQGSEEAAVALAGLSAPSAEAETARAAENVIRIPVGKMDALLEAVSELAICQAQVTAGVLEMAVHGALAAEAGRLEKISRQLQQVVLGLRMVPVQPLFIRISRQAHDLSRRVGKPLRVELEGGETEVDKGLVEELFEPLLHLVRNALDHGLDTPEQRRAAGKPAEGLLRLAAFHQGSDFVLQMRDDGRGFDLAAIAAKARAQGLLNPGEEPAPERLIDLLFHSGFSTAQALTDLSGRGVGLDAVRRRVAGLKGSVSATHVPGQGATFTLRFPLTMALMDAILVRSRGERFALPAASVLRFLAWDSAGHHRLGEGQGWFEAAGRSLPLLDLGAEGAQRPVALHVSAGGREACLVVDEVLGKQQVVVKALGGLLQGVSGLGGGAVLADGRVGLILDLESLLAQRVAA